ncbi:sensor histidine kinase [Mangrovibacillus cuniculi]|uniref:histidine kinase n=1 Tax=Mangrovibacillus cuniculi TaxID=2593652 RepID=A0A7S8HEG6_9BACI|nr:ATP-binding protein [Mangrovibacillus cuniculi]QPC45713.1 HAMP domain-containing protein [Mangrovibacillus cuniculi]
MKNWSFRNRILFTQLFIICIFSGSSLFLVYTIGDVHQVSQSIHDERLPELSLYSKWTETLRARKAIVRNYIQGTNQHTVISNYESLIHSQGMPLYIPSSLAGVKTDIERLDFLMINNVKGLILYNNNEAAREFLLTEYIPLLNDIIAEVDRRQLAALSLLSDQSNSMEDSIYHSLWLLFVLTAVTIAGSILFAYRISRHLTKPVESLVTQVDTIASGKYGYTIKSLEQIELNQLAQSINHMSSELKSSFTKVVESRNYREQMVNSLPIGIVTILDNESTISLNKEAQEKLSFLDRDIHTIHPEDLPDENYDFWLLFFSKSAFQMKKLVMDLPIGHEVWLVSQVHLLDQNDKKIGRLLYFIDVTESTKLEERMRQSEKLASVGEMAAGAAHEIRNPLAVIHGFLTIMEQSFSAEMRNEYYLPLIQKEIKRINLIIEEMLLLAKPGAPIMRKSKIIDVLNELIPLYDMEQNVQFQIDICDMELYIDPKQMKQVFHNLFRNSLEAMNTKGTISIWSEHLDGTYKVLIKDNGPGMSEETIQKMFEPFYSSKESGTGLGLTIIQRIMENHDGRIELQESNHQGTTFVLVFPV